MGDFGKRMAAQIQDAENQRKSARAEVNSESSGDATKRCAIAALIEIAPDSLFYLVRLVGESFIVDSDAIGLPSGSPVTAATAAARKRSSCTLRISVCGTVCCPLIRPSTDSFLSLPMSS